MVEMRESAGVARHFIANQVRLRRTAARDAANRALRRIMQAGLQLRVFCVGRPRGKILNVPPVARPRGLRGRTSVGRTHPWVGRAPDRERRCGAAWSWSWRYIRAISKVANTKGHTLGGWPFVIPGSYRSDVATRLSRSSSGFHGHDGQLEVECRCLQAVVDWNRPPPAQHH